MTVGKKAKNKQRRTEQRRRDEAALADAARETAAACVAQLLDQIEAEASGRLEQMLGGTQREATAFAGALAGILADSRVAAREGIDGITTNVGDVAHRCVELQAVATDLETRARGHIAEIRSRGDAALAQLEEALTEVRARADTRVRTEIDRAAADAAARFEASQRAIDEHVDRFGEHLAGQVALVSMQAEQAGRTLAELAAAHAVEPVEESHDTVDDRSHTADDTSRQSDAAIWQDLARATLPGETHVEDDEFFFSRLAEELRADTDDGDPPISGDTDDQLSATDSRHTR